MPVFYLKMCRQASFMLNRTSVLQGILEIILLWKEGKQGEISREVSLDLSQLNYWAVMCYMAALQF